MKKKMSIRKMRRRCYVPGCTNVDTFSVSRTGEHGALYVCAECLADALDLANGNEVEEKSVESAKPFDFYASALIAPTGHIGNKGELGEPGVITDAATPETESFICPKCGKDCSSKIGLFSHEKSCVATSPIDVTFIGDAK